MVLKSLKNDELEVNNFRQFYQGGPIFSQNLFLYLDLYAGFVSLHLTA